MNDINKVSLYKELKINQEFLYNAKNTFHENLSKFDISFHSSIIRQYNAAINSHNRAVRKYFPKSKGLFVLLVYKD
jgi:hypothetical protein